MKMTNELISYGQTNGPHHDPGKKHQKQTDTEFEGEGKRLRQEKQKISKSRALASPGSHSCEPENASLGLRSPRGIFLRKCLLWAWQLSPLGHVSRTPAKTVNV